MGSRSERLPNSEGLVSVPILIVINCYRFICKYSISIRRATTATGN